MHTGCAYRDLMETSTSIAARFHVSDTYVHEVFDRYVMMIYRNKYPL